MYGLKNVLRDAIDANFCKHATNTLHKIYKAYRYTYYSKSVTFTERKAPLESNVPMSSSFSAILHSGNSVKKSY